MGINIEVEAFSVTLRPWELWHVPVGTEYLLFSTSVVLEYGVVLQ